MFPFFAGHDCLCCLCFIKCSCSSQARGTNGRHCKCIQCVHRFIICNFGRCIQCVHQFIICNFGWLREGRGSFCARKLSGYCLSDFSKFKSLLTFCPFFMFNVFSNRYVIILAIFDNLTVFACVAFMHCDFLVIICSSKEILFKRNCKKNKIVN